MNVIADPDADLIATAYREILLPSFPADELVELDELFDPNTVVRIAMVGDLVSGVFVYDLFDGGRTALCSYVAVRPKMAGNRIGHAILARLMREVGPYDLVLGEVEIPGAASPTARQRVMFFQRFGLSALDVPYFQPAIRPGRPRISPMLLVLVHACPVAIVDDQLVGERLATFVAEYVERAEGPAGLDCDQSDALITAARGPVDIVSLTDKVHSYERQLLVA
jgi:hypothetical protein